MKVKIFLASPRGFCAGVKRALNIIDETIAYSHKLNINKIYALHEIVHNRTIVEHYRNLNVEFVESLDEIPNGSVVIFSAHGVSPQIRATANSKNLKVVDATCPLVQKVHTSAIKYAKQKHHIILIGHKKHDEMEGTYGEAKAYCDNVSIVESLKDVDLLAQKMGNLNENIQIAYLTQTTLSLQETASLVEYLKKVFSNIKSPNENDICYATTNRQNAVQNLLDNNIDLLIVVGSKNSSNTNRLYEMGKNTNINALRVDNKDELNDYLLKSNIFKSDIDKSDNSLKKCHKIGITSGASVPDHLVEEIAQYLESYFKQNAFTVEINETKNFIKEEMQFSIPPVKFSH